MKGRVRNCSSQLREPLAGPWEMAQQVPGDSGGQAPAANWGPAIVPGTVAAGLQAAGQWSLESPARSFDSEEWWYRTRFETPSLEPGERLVLGFEGLATQAEIWLDGKPLGQCSNMFLALEFDISAFSGRACELLIRFAPLQSLLARKRSRPRWRTPMVAHQQLRWIRTTLLGRTPGWSVPAAAVGPWRPVWLERRRLDISDVRLAPRVQAGHGVLDVEFTLASQRGASVASGSLELVRSGRKYSAPMHAAGDGRVRGRLDIEQVELWWPHTHGEPALYDCHVLLEVIEAGSRSRVELDLGAVGFRTVRLDRHQGGFGLTINDVPVFCRGAVWTPLDCVSLNAQPDDYRIAIERVRAAGMNMLRLAGPFVPETDVFFDLCDRSGVLVWHDFMFANMDYPAADPEFSASVASECAQLLTRLQGRASLAMLCGNSECSQQAAMSGAPRELWTQPLFETTLAAIANEYCPDVPYCPSSTHGGDLPFAADQGVCSYYGVGAYLRPVADARRSELKFASECLAFANIPESETLQSGATVLHFNQPRWKERAPRDLGAGWDFDDVRDHYLQAFFRLEPGALRYGDQDRYLRLGRAASGEAMSGAFTEWRRARSSCRGALILFLRDLWMGAGWGIIDSRGIPKAPYYFLKRSLQSRAVFITDEGCNGLRVHIVNEQPTPLRGRLQLELFKASEPVGRPVTHPLSLGPAATLELNAIQLFDGFLDLSYAYRFGPPTCDLIRASVLDQEDREVASTFYFPLGLPNTQSDIGLVASARTVSDGIEIDVQTQAFAHSVHIEAPGYLADDQYFHLAPRSRRTVTLKPYAAKPSAFEGVVYALNATHPRRLVLS